MVCWSACMVCCFGCPIHSNCAFTLAKINMAQLYSAQLGLTWLVLACVYITQPRSEPEQLKWECFVK